MAHCININSNEYKSLSASLQGIIPEVTLKAAVAVWQEKNGIENWPTVDAIKSMYSSDPMLYALDEFSNIKYEDIDLGDIDADEALASSGIESGSDEEKTIKYNIVKKNLYFNIRQLSNRIFRLNERVRKSSSKVVTANLNKQIALLEEQLEKYKTQYDAFKDVRQIEQLKSYAEDAIARVKEITQQPSLSSEDIEEARRLVHLWSTIGDFSPTLAEGHPIFNADELELNSLKYGFNNADGSHEKGFVDFKNEMDTLGRAVEQKAADIVLEFVRKELKDNDITKEAVMKAMADINFAQLLVLDLSRIDDPLIQSIAKSVRRVNDEALREIQSKVDKLEQLYEKAKAKIGKDFSRFIQKTKDGKQTGNLVFRYSQDYSELRQNLYYEARADKTPTGWAKYYDWLRTDTMHFDVRILFDTEGNPLLTPEAEAHKEELIKHLGEKGFEIFYKQQQTRLMEYLDAKEGFKLALEDRADVNDTQKTLLMEQWEAMNSPFINLDRVLDKKNIVIGGQSIAKGRSNYNIYIPRRTRADGSETGYYDSNYDFIENDEDLFNYYNYIIDSLKEVRSFLPEADRKFLQVNSLPYIKQKLVGMYNEGGLKLGGGAIAAMLQSLYSETLQSEVEHGEEDLSSGIINRTASMQFKDTTAEQISTQVSIRSVEYIKANNGKQPTMEIVRKWRNEIRDELSKQKSWDINSVMKMYMASAMAYKHKSAISSVLNLAQAAVVQKEAIKHKGTLGSIDFYGNPITEQSLKNIVELMTYTTDVFYGMPRYAIEGKIKQVIRKGYETEHAKLTSALQTNEENFRNGFISDAQYKRNDKYFKREIARLEKTISASAIGDGILKYGQLVGMGYNVIAGIVNLMVGSMENATMAADARLINPKALSLAYKDVLLILGNKGTPIGKKVINLDRKLDITKKAQNELYTETSEFWHKFRAFSPFKITEKTEMINQLPLAFALMRTKTSYDNNGKEISMWEAFDENGEVKSGYMLSKDMSNDAAISDYQIQVSQLIAQVHGNYNASSPLYGKKFVIGRVGFQFRTWMPEMFMRRFGGEQPDRLLGIKTKGRWRSYAAVLKATKGQENPDVVYSKMENIAYTIKALGRKLLFIPQYKYALDSSGNKVSYKEAYDKHGRLKSGYKPVRAFDDRMSELDARNMRANLVELALIIQVVATQLLIKAMMPDLDDDKRRAAIGLLNISGRLKSDILMFANPVEYDKINKNLLPIFGYVNNVVKWGYDATTLIANDDEDNIDKFIRQTATMTPGLSQVKRVITYTDQQFGNKN